MVSHSFQDTPTVVSLFSGGGGLDLGLEAAGFKVLFATDIDEHSCITLNWGRVEAKERDLPFMQHASVWERDIRDEVDANFVLQATQMDSGEIDLLAGGPPCQAFSIFGRREGLDDPRGTLAYEYLRLLKNLRPKSFVFENVYGLLSIEEGKVFDELCERLSNPDSGLNYEISTHRLDASKHGVPQFRDRVFIIGSREGQEVSEVPKITSEPSPGLFEKDLLPWRTVRHALEGLPDEGSDNLANHTGRDHSQRIIDRYAGLDAGERDPKTRINKLDLTRPSFTIIVGSDQGGGKGHIHPVEPREVTPRESARIQTFPDWWAFSGTTRHPIRQVGNAVPPLLGAAVGNAIRDQIFGLERISFETVIDLLDQKHLFDEEEIKRVSAALDGTNGKTKAET